MMGEGSMEQDLAVLRLVVPLQGSDGILVTYRGWSLETRQGESGTARDIGGWGLHRDGRRDY